jgi:hypothetical protein
MRVLNHLVIPKADYANALILKEASSLLVAASRWIRVMLPTVDFDRQPFFMTVKVEHVRVDWVLTSELTVGEPAVPQKPPHQRLGVGLSRTKFAGEL